MSRNEFRSEYQRWEAERRRRETIKLFAAWVAIGLTMTVLVFLAFRAWGMS